jgi:glycosyltransferase involved in cell wall biosynthesis
MAVTSSYSAPAGRSAPVPERVLLVSWGLPPSANGSSVIVENLSHQFSPQEMVLAGQQWSGMESYRRDSKLPRIHLLNKEWTWPKRGQRYVRWTTWLTLPRVARQLARIARIEHCDAIIAVFPNEFFVYAAYLAAKRLRLPFYLYFHNTYRESRLGNAQRFAEWLEPRVFRHARAVFVMSDGMKAHYEPIYPHVRFESLVHSFSEPVPEFAPAPPPGKTLRLAFMGHLNGSNVDASRRLAEVVNRRDDLRMTTYSGTPDWYFDNVGVSGPRIAHTRVAYEQVTPALQSHDVLLLPHGFCGTASQLEYDTIFPTRTISYLISNRPIMAHTPPTCFLTRWLRKYDCAEIVDERDANKVEAALDRLRNDKQRREQLVRNALQAAQQFYGPVVAKRLRQIMAETMSPSPAPA